MATAKIQSGDKVKIISGNFKGTLGFVTKVIPFKNSKRISVDSIKKITKYQKSNKQYGVAGQMSLVDRFIDISNAMLVTGGDVVSKAAIQKTDKGTIRIFKKDKSSVIKNTKEDPKSDTIKADKKSKK